MVLKQKKQRQAVWYETPAPQVGAHLKRQTRRLEALDSAVELEASKGQKAHIWLSAGEVRHIMTKPRGRMARRDKVVMALLLGAGLRRDELVHLTWKDVMLMGKRTVLDVTGKGAKARVIPISERLRDILEDWKAFCT